jgi:hypothetical protein
VVAMPLDNYFVVRKNPKGGFSYVEGHESDPENFGSSVFIDIPVTDVSKVYDTFDDCMTAALEDSADVFLDSKTFTKDVKGISGIYYSRTVVTGMNDDMTGNKFIKKFLVTYDDAEALLTLNTRYSYETKDRTKFIKPALFGYRGGNKSREYAIIKGIGKLYYEEGSMDNQYLMHTTYGYAEDLQGKLIRSEEGFLENNSITKLAENSGFKSVTTFNNTFFAIMNFFPENYNK